MGRLYRVEDEWHDEVIGDHAIRAEAIAQLEGLAALPWDAAPNRCPCTNWRRCSRRYVVVTYDTSVVPWRRMCVEPMLDVSAVETLWLGTP